MYLAFGVNSWAVDDRQTDYKLCYFLGLVNFRANLSKSFILWIIYVIQIIFLRANGFAKFI